MKHYAIHRIYLRYDTTSDDIDACLSDERMAAFDAELKILASKYALHLESQDTRHLNATKMSVCECAGCGTLMINRDKNPAGFDGDNLWLDAAMDIGAPLVNGGSHEGRDLCIECLPVEHRWGFFS